MRRLSLVVFVVFVLFYNHVVFAQTGGELKAITEELKSLREGQSGIRKDIQEIESILGIKQAKPEPKVIIKEVEPEFKDKVISIDDRPSKGDKKAKLIFVEISDYQCSFCGQFVREALPQIEAEYTNKGKIRYVFIDYPIEAVHENALKAALAANCAGDQGKFWQMHDRLFENQNALDSANLLRYAEGIGLDMVEFKKCFDGGKYLDRIQSEYNEAVKIGVGSVPTFLLGYAESGGKIKVAKSLRGAQPYSKYREMIESVLSPRK